MDKSIRYMVFRIYTAKERPDREQRSVFFGWSHSKDVIKGFMSQRDNKKYRVVKMTDDDIQRYFSEDVTDGETAIDILPLKTTSSDEEIQFFSTTREVHEAEIMIQRLFHELSSVANIKGDGNYLEMIYNLKDYYAEALYFIGYRPQEFDILFQSADPRDSYNNLYQVEEQINDAYDGMVTFPHEEDDRGLEIEGLSVIEDVSSRIIYSLESFVKVLREDL